MKIGLLPLYIKLYDDCVPAIRPRLEAFYDEIAGLFEQKGVEVVKSGFCRIKPEFEESVTMFEEAGVDAIVTLHMAYSPSLESIDSLVQTKLPVIVLDTTETLEFTNMQDPGEISYCHGIHGVMDMCSMLKRYGKPYAIAAGHFKEEDCIERVCGFVKAAIAAKALSNAYVGLVGGSFAGMGDFDVPVEELKAKFGITVETVDAGLLGKKRGELSREEIALELAANEAAFDFAENVIREEYEEAAASCLALRKVVAEKAYTAFSVNFLQVGPENGLMSMPFLESCKAMEQGIGYAGEGDALTAAFTGAFLKSYPETNFVEIFCPDWKNNMLFMSHMGELNYRVADTKPVITRLGKNYTKGMFPYAGYTRMKGGKGVYVNVSRDKDDYQLLLADAEMLAYEEDNFAGSMRGWMKPAKGTTAEFLEHLSINGATHHSSFVYGATVEELKYFGALLSMKVVVI